MTPQEEVRQRHRSRRLPELAELLYQFDKGNPCAKLSDLRSDGARGVYISAALGLFEPTIATERMRKVQEADAQQFATHDDSAERIAQRARQDVERYGTHPGNFGTTRPGYCYLCKERITPADAFVLEITATLKVDVHGSCALQDARCETLTAFAFRWIGGL